MLAKTLSEGASSKWIIRLFIDSRDDLKLTPIQITTSGLVVV